MQLMANKGKYRSEDNPEHTTTLLTVPHHRALRGLNWPPQGPKAAGGYYGIAYWSKYSSNG